MTAAHSFKRSHRGGLARPVLPVPPTLPARLVRSLHPVPPVALYVLVPAGVRSARGLAARRFARRMYVDPKFYCGHKFRACGA